jgi:hypothetical protein
MLLKVLICLFSQKVVLQKTFKHIFKHIDEVEIIQCLLAEKLEASRFLTDNGKKSRKENN